MNHELGCTVCGHAVEASTAAFLLSVVPYTHWLRVQRWDKNLAQAAGICTACHSAHAVEIAALWMATGRLQMAFATSTSAVAPLPIARRLPTREYPPHFTRGRTGSSLVGELEMDPSVAQDTSVANIGLLATVLDALLEAMDRAPHKIPAHPAATGNAARALRLA